MSNVMYTNAVYFPNYRVYNGDTPGQLNYGCINHVYYAFATVSADGQVLVSCYLFCESGTFELIPSMTAQRRVRRSPSTM